jgi:hypothetical protein
MDIIMIINNGGGGWVVVVNDVKETMIMNKYDMLYNN